MAPIWPHEVDDTDQECNFLTGTREYDGYTKTGVDKFQGNRGPLA